jgi:uncharacterized protein YjdB
MRRKISSYFIAAALLFSILFVGQFVLHAKTAYAAVDTAGDFATLKSKVSTAFKANPTAYKIVYTGPFTNTTLLDLKTSLFEDEYLYYSLKSFGLSASSTQGILTISIPATYWETTAQKAAVDTKVATILAEIITPGMNDFSKEKAIHDWIITHVAYDTSLVQHSAYAALFGSFKTVCQGYALLAYRMLTDPSVNIPAHIVVGKVHGTGHTWILAQIGGKWYHLDPTWDDPVPDIANRKVYAYYNLTDAQIAVDHTWSPTSPITYPTATTEFADALTTQKTADSGNLTVYQDLEDSLGFKYLLNANTVSTKNDLMAYLQTANAANQTSLNFRYMNAATFAADLKAVLPTFTNITGYSYTSESFTRTTSSADALTHLVLTSNTPVPVTEVTVSQATATVKVKGSSLTLSATVSPDNASNKSITWSSDNPVIASVSPRGVVTGLKAGTVTITVYAPGGDHTSVTSTITVLEGVTGIQLNKRSLSVKVDSSDSTLKANVLPTSATVQDVTYSSSKPEIATVDMLTGVITGKSPGTTIITAKSVDGLKVVSATVTVPVNVTDITLNKSEYFIPLSKKASAVPQIKPLKATTKTVTWDTQDHNVATVSDRGIITAGSTPGFTTLTATTVDEGKTVTAAVYTVVPVIKIVFTTKSAFVKVGESLTISPGFTPSDATIQNVTYTSNKPGVAFVDENGKITGVTPGSAIIKATTREGKKIATFAVTVPLNVDSLTLNKTGEVQVNVGKTVPLTAAILPVKATIKKVNWTSSNDLIAQVSKTGVISGKAYGYATITATPEDNPSLAKSVTVAVYNQLVSVNFPKASLILKYHTSDSSIKVVYVKPDATLPANSTVYSSSNTAAVTVDSVTGDVYAAGGGVSRITATVTAHDVTKTAVYTVTVPYPVLGIIINKGSAATVDKNKTLALAAVINPTNAANKVIAWTSSDESVATVNPATGLVKAGSKAGSTVIRATSDYDNSLIAEITINVP